MRLVFMGTPEFAVPTLDALLAAGHTVALVLSQPDRPAGRGRQLRPPPVAALARERGLELLQPRGLRSPEIQQRLAAAAPEAIVVAAYARLLPPAVLALPPRGCLNVHPSLLPRHRGPAPIQGALLAGDTLTGTSIILLEERLDAGPILAQEPLPIAPDDDAASLEPRLAAQGARLLVETLPRWAAGQVTAEPQDDSLATYAPRIQREDARLDWSLPAVDLWRRVRAYRGWPDAFTSWNGRQLKLLAARPGSPHAEPAPPGTVLRSSEERPPRPAVATGDGTLVLDTVALEGKRPTDAAEFVRGYPSFVGSVLGS